MIKYLNEIPLTIAFIVLLIAYIRYFNEFPDDLKNGYKRIRDFDS